MEESEIDYSNLANALKRLEERYKDYEYFSKNETLILAFRESLIESCIQRFEVCYDTLWKLLKKFLKEETGLVDIPNAPKSIFRIAYENKIIEDFKIWFNYNQNRIDTTHDYSVEKMEKTFNAIPFFISDSIELYETMTKQKWI